MKVSLLSLVQTLCAVGILIVPALSRADTYCCVDSNGQSICGDFLVPACYGRGYKILAPSGRTVREVAAPLTAAERRQREEDAQRQMNQTRTGADQRRRDQTLLETYSSVNELDSRRDRDLDMMTSEINRIRARESDTLRERGALQKMRTSATGTAARDLDSDLSSNQAELSQIRTLMSIKQRDMEQLRLRYASDRSRLIELLRQQGTLDSTAPSE